ncbi:MAG TPA: STAS domain-containing protein [Bryobacteraceae bacterium]|nr:STAS domain-containing protein [Bryobacteraceae bacterium]
MTIEFEHKDDVCFLRLKGRFITGGDAGYLKAKTDELKACGCRKVLADFRDVPYVDSTGIAFVVGVYTSVTRSLGGRFVVSTPNHRVREILDLTRLSTVIPIADDEASALEFLRAEASAAHNAE